MKHKVRRIVSLTTVLTIGAMAIGTFAGCTTQHPEVTITYSFNGSDYEVTYTLSRNDAPKTVQHFIELADAGFYDGTCVHNYTSDALYAGGYKLNGSELEEIDYFTTVKELEKTQGITFTQSVWMANADRTPLYTVYGEFSKNGVTNERSREYVHSAGALVMYYTEKVSNGKTDYDVIVERSDGGKNNDGNAEQTVHYSTNSATSLFYTFKGASNTVSDSNYCVFGMAEDYENELEKGLFAAIGEYEESLADDASFTEHLTPRLNEYEPFENIAKGDIDGDFETPVDKPIIIKSVKVNKY